MFGREVRFDEVLLVDSHEGEDDAGDADGCKYGSSLFQVEAVGCLKNQRNCGQSHV